MSYCTPCKEEEETRECPLCYEEIEEKDLCKTPCNRIYHAKCIEKWFVVNSSCPICARPTFLHECKFNSRDLMWAHFARKMFTWFCGSIKDGCRLYPLLILLFFSGEAKHTIWETIAVSVGFFVWCLFVDAWRDLYRVFVKRYVTDILVLLKYEMIKQAGIIMGIAHVFPAK